MFYQIKIGTQVKVFSRPTLQIAEDKESRKFSRRTWRVHFALKLSLCFSLTPGPVSSSLAQQFCRPRSRCPSKHKEKRVGQKKKRGKMEMKKASTGGKEGWENLKEKKIAFLYLNVPPHHSARPCPVCTSRSAQILLK